MARKTKKKQQPEEMTISEFKIWIKGIEAFQGDDWIPNKEQWELIKATIDMIDETAPEVEYATPPQPAHYQQPQVSQNVVRRQSAKHIQQAPSALDSTLSAPPVAPTPIAPIDSHNVTGGVPKPGPTSATGLSSSTTLSGDAGMKDASNLI